MPTALDHLPHVLIDAGSATVWLFGLAALLRALVLTGVLIPGTAIVILGGILVQRGLLDGATLVWVIALGSVAGAEISFLLGRIAGHGPSEPAGGPLVRAAAMIDRRGGSGLVAARFHGALAGIAPFEAGRAGMPHGPFALWNAAGAAVHTVVLFGMGQGIGLAAGTLGAIAPRPVVFGAVVIAALAVLLGTWGHIRRHGAATLAVLRALRAALLRRPCVRRQLDRHPRLAGFVAARFGTDQFMGLAGTILAALLIYIAVAYADSVLDFLGGGDVLSADARIANLFHAMRDDRITAVMAWITQAGGRHGVVPMLAGTTLALLMLRRHDLLGGLWIAAIGNQVTVTLLKALFDRPRSALGYFTETSGSFPSGHAAGALAVWAMLFYLAWRSRLVRLDVAIVGAIVTAALIGLSRVYLVVHYVSDVLNGALVGGFWLTLGIAFCEWRRFAPRAAPSVRHRTIAAGCVGFAALTVIVGATMTVSPLNPAVNRTILTVTTPANLLADTGLPAMTEVLSGAPRKGIDLIVAAPDEEALSQALQSAGWIAAPRPNLARLVAAIVDGWTGRPPSAALVVPTFWDDRPTALAFARPGPKGDAIHLRLWDSLTRTADGGLILVGTVTQEDPLDWIAADRPARAVRTPAVDRLVAELAARGLEVSRP